MTTTTKTRVRYPDPLSEAQLDFLERLLDGKTRVKHGSTQLRGFQIRGLVNASGGLTPMGRQLAQMRHDLRRSQERLGQARHANAKPRILADSVQNGN